MKRLITLAFLFIIGIYSLQAKTDKFGTWLEVELTKKLFKKFELSFIPEVRWQDDFTVDKYQFDFKLGYEPFKFFNLAAAYRIKTNVKNKANETTNRFVFDATGKQGFGRFDASLRARVTNYSDEVDVKNTFIRPRIKLAYDIKGNKIKPYTSYELFRDLTNKEWRKSRFDIGFNRKIGKHHRIGLYYRLQDYSSNRNSINILGVNYRFKI
jgi:hypothetical protein